MLPVHDGTANRTADQRSNRRHGIQTPDSCSELADIGYTSDHGGDDGEGAAGHETVQDAEGDDGAVGVRGEPHCENEYAAQCGVEDHDVEDAIAIAEVGGDDAAKCTVYCGLVSVMHVMGAGTYEAPFRIDTKYVANCVLMPSALACTITNVNGRNPPR
jgi:hypothetical protein